MASTVTNQKPLIITGTGAMAQDFWTAIGVPVGQGKPIVVDKIVWVAPGASASFTITDASTGANVIAEGSTPATFVGADPEYDFPNGGRPWRNWKVTALSAGTLVIYYH
ncbi:MAG TPA: hypothetical protein VHA06_17855 [Candidatus Angelobacter sp.]|jgi:hypothetical protein|nr:hypothetical protein [Candidatus Angelobacter sp.]